MAELSNIAPIRRQDDTSSGSPPGGGDLEKRVERLEATMSDVQVRLVRIEAKFESIEDRMATKADLHEMAVAFHKSMNEQTWKFLAGATGMAALFSAVAFGLARSMS
ncbi:putative membrane protein [Pseudomonas syringae group genomosp. 3]|uniref:Putative membrane protein n=1 Tax=Pseudomonas syringae group genomosp. 3 TaxID=251701 RepID=A0A2K4WJE7_9PSED|nr:putative membrane protein [Pseudomonas syringae group genomosp. 3]